MLAKTHLLLAILVLIGGRALYARSPDAQPKGAPAPDTKITVANWRDYQQFMSEGMIALFEGNHFWRVPQELEIDVGPTISIPLPAKYLNDTEKFSDHVTLTKLPNGGYVPEGYVAGVPFPRPLSGDPALIGERIFWNSYYRYQ